MADQAIFSQSSQRGQTYQLHKYKNHLSRGIGQSSPQLRISKPGTGGNEGRGNLQLESEPALPLDCSSAPDQAGKRLRGQVVLFTTSCGQRIRNGIQGPLKLKLSSSFYSTFNRVPRTKRVIKTLHSVLELSQSSRKPQTWASRAQPASFTFLKGLIHLPLFVGYSMRAVHCMMTATRVSQPRRFSGRQGKKWPHTRCF